MRQSAFVLAALALSFTGWEPPASNGNPQPKFEGTLYLVWKRKD